jgi:hypothetical protein
VKPKCWEKNQSRCPFVHHKFYVHCPGTDTGLHGENPPAGQAHTLQHNLAHIESAYSPFSAETTIYNGQNFASVFALVNKPLPLKAVFYGYFTKCVQGLAYGNFETPNIIPIV